MAATAHLPSIGHVHAGCLNCAGKPEHPPMDWQPHPGFGMLGLTCDGVTPEWWHEYCDVHRYVYAIDKGWTTLRRRDGTEVEYFDGDWYIEWARDEITLGEIEECCAEDPDHDWRLRIEGPMYGAVYQRQGADCWVPVERLDGFA